MITYTKGDLLKEYRNGMCDVIAHCANCQRVMGSGIAYQIKNEMPSAYDAYIEFDNDEKGCTKCGICQVGCPYDFIWSSDNFIRNNMNHIKYIKGEVINCTKNQNGLETVTYQQGKSTLNLTFPVSISYIAPTIAISLLDSIAANNELFVLMS